MLLVSDKDRKTLQFKQRTLQHFLSGDVGHPPWPKRSLPSLLAAANEVADFRGYWIVTNSNPLRSHSPASAPISEESGLEDVEMRLMAEWMLRPTGSDVRLALREALHDFQLQQRGYRYVLIDCPARLSTACINALAASDFILVPVLLDATSARSAPSLLGTLRRLRSEKLFPHLRCLGVVANNVDILNDRLIAREARIWKDLPSPCRAVWEDSVYLFETHIPHSAAVAEWAGPILSADEGSWPQLAMRDGGVREVFNALLTEMEARIEHEGKVLAVVPSQPAVSPLGG
jgi:cellulose biosynthesis protein BcsQ